MNKKTYLIIIWSITLLVVLFVCFKTARGIRLNFHWNFHDDDIEYSANEDSSTGYSHQLESFTKIDITTKVIEITLREGSDYHIQASYNSSRYKPEFSVKNGTLEVKQTVPKGNNSSINTKLEITVPAGIELKNVEIDNNVGAINLKNIRAKDITLNNNVGEISVKNPDCKRLEAKTNVGEVDITSVEDLADYEIDAKTDIGEVNFKRKSYKLKYHQKGSNGKKIEAKTNIGEVSIS